ncbi:MAG: transcription termination/antitermination protein NusG [Enterobacter hormaechei]
MSEAPKKRWYVVQAFSGFEGRVATSLREHIKLQIWKSYLAKLWFRPKKWLRSVAPTSQKRAYFSRLRAGSGKMNDAELAPGAAYHVMGFIGGTSDRPAPISDKEVDGL